MPEQIWFHKFFDDLYGRVLAGQFDPAKTLRQARLIKRVLRLRKGQSVLDCPCGQGRLTVPLAKMGLRMTGIDFQPGYLARARRAAKKERLKIEFVRCDMRKLPFTGRFDAAINWFTSFGYFSDAGNLVAARAAFAALKPGGRFLIEMQNKSWLVNHFLPRARETINGVEIIHRHRWNRRASRVESTWTFRLGQRVERHSFSIRAYSGPELRALLRAAGFRDIRLFGRTLAGTARLTRHSRRVIAVGTKPVARSISK